MSAPAGAPAAAPLPARHALRSLRVRLSLFLIALAALVALGLGGATYVSVRAEADALFDYHLRQTALSLRDQGRIADEDRAVLQRADADLVVQVWSAEGVVLYSTKAAPPMPPRAVIGFSTYEAGGQSWRVYGAATSQRVVQVAQPLAVRRTLAADAAWRSVLPLALAAPLVALALWWLVGASLAPLERVVAAVRRRDALALQPLPAAGLPNELAPLVEAFNALLARLDSAFDAQRAFVADAAHELRSPLTALKLQVGLLRAATGAEEREAAMARLAGGVERAQHLVEQLLALARADPGVAPARAEVDLVELVRQVLADALPAARARGAELSLDAPPRLALQGDAALLRSLVRNLVDNALEHGGAAPQVGVALARDDGAGAPQARLRVDDDGPGLPPAERERVFARFYRREPGRGRGSGLGLAIVRAIVQQHGGQVVLDEAPGGGLRVEVLLPLDAATPSSGAPFPAPPP